MNYDTAKALGQDLKKLGVDQYGRLELNEDTPEFGEGYSLRLHTGAASLPAGLLRALAELDLGLSYLGEKSRSHRCLWLIETDR